MHVWFPLIQANSGADIFVERLASALATRGVQTTVTRFGHYYELAPDLLSAVRPPQGVDVIHANTAYAFAFRRRGCKLVATELHYLLDPAFRPFKSFAQHLYHRGLLGHYLRRSHACADAVTAISEFTAKVLAEHAGVRAAALPLWVDLQRFSPGPTANVPVPRDAFRLLFVGNASARKGADVLKPLLGRLGDGFEIVCTAGLRQRLQDEGISGVRLLGRLSEAELIEEYRRCDAVLVPSRYEGFGYSALEGMACAKPVVGFRSGAIAEVAVDEVTALLSDIDDIDGLAARCLRLRADPGLARRMGEAGRRRAEVVYAEDRAVSAYMGLYRSLVA